MSKFAHRKTATALNYILFDDKGSEHLLPLTYTRPSCELRIGITTIRQKWEHYLGAQTSTMVFRKYLETKFPAIYHNDNVFINARLLPNEALLQAINALEVDEGLTYKGENIAFRTNPTIGRIKLAEYNAEVLLIKRPFDIFSHNGDLLAADYAILTQGRTTAKASPTNTILSPENVFIEEGVKMEAVILNASTGPIYIGKNAEIMEGSVIRGPFALCEGAVVKLAAKIYGPTTIGPQCRVGGEVNNSVLQGYSNKGHDGFLGNAVLGEWCNIGADSNNSNLKNTYEEVKLWDYALQSFAPTGLQFCGLIMGDHSKCGINTMFNTGTVIGVGANVFGAGYPPNFIDSFVWGGMTRIAPKYRFDKFLQTATEVMHRRKIELDQVEQNILKEIYNETTNG